MSREKTRQTIDNRRFAAFLILVAFLASAFPSILFARTVLAVDPLPENNSKVYHDNEYFELYHTVNGEVTSKKLEYLFAETTTGSTRPVYCVMAGAPTPENGSITSAAMNDSGAASLLGKIQYVIEMDSSSFSIEDTINGYPHIHYYVKQLLIWHLVYLYQGTLGSSAQTYFNGIDLNSFVDGQGSGPTAKKILAEAKRLWSVYDSAGRPSKAGAYTPNYRAEVRDVSELQFDASTKKYRATFTVNVRETKTGATGGTFRFSQITGGKVFIKGADGKYTSQAGTLPVYASGSSFQIEGSFSELKKVSGGRMFGVQIMTVSNSGNEQPQQMYGYFFDSSLTASGKTKQTYVGWHQSSAKTFEGSETTWMAPT
ncbi:MAG: thioester domain-containing protein, partial [Clostridiales bacterium]|nr:thioester domain-containing protein [Clostridiales bacterium]